MPRPSDTAAVYWVAWFLAFLAFEIFQLATGHPENTLSEFVWHLEDLGHGWTFARYFLAAGFLWLFFHMAFGWFR